MLANSFRGGDTEAVQDERVISSRTKVIATMGPALDPPGVLERMLQEGVDVLRVNLSHGTPAQQAHRVARARACKPDIAVLADLGGPKLRLADLPGPVTVASGDEMTLGPNGLPVADPRFPDRVKKGDPVFLVDGAICAEVVGVDGRKVHCRVIVGGTLTSRKGINLPNDHSALPCLTEKDLRDIAELDLIAPDFVALSYVRHESDIEALRRLCHLPIIAKVEKQQAVERMEEIVAAADAIMVARGDLGVEIPIEKVPATQKLLIRAANAAGRPVITATQMLVSMVTSSLPTRAEVTDVANAVLDGTDAVMLSEETAAGRDPPGVVALMERILRETEPLLRPSVAPTTSVRANALAEAAAHLAENMGAAALLAPTKTGITAQRLSAFRPKQPILAFSKRPETVRRLALSWGVRTVQLGAETDENDLAAAAIDGARRILPSGSPIVLLSLGPPGAPQSTSFIRAMTL
jgi:pyruvate kinase